MGVLVLAIYAAWSGCRRLSLRSLCVADGSRAASVYAIIDSMAQLVVRNIDEAIVKALKLRAAARGVSAEAEHREILREALLAKKRKGSSFKDMLAAMPDVGEDADFEFVRDLDRPDGLPG
jgi:antitoxin FitA